MYQFSDKTDNFDFLGPNLPKNGFWGRNFKNLTGDTMWTNFQTKWTTLNFGAQKWFLGLEFQKSKSGFRINTSIIPCVPIFSQNGQLWIFWTKFGEIAQLRAILYFGWNIVESVAESWVEAEMSWVEVCGGWNDLGGGGWSWVHSLVIPVICFRDVWKESI